MQSRLKIMTVLVTMVAMFAMLPALSAVAAEPLDDGPYTVVVGEQSLPMTVVDGEPLVPATSGIDWYFDYDQETGRVLDEFEIVVDGVAYEVEVGEDRIGYASPTDEPVGGQSEAPAPLALSTDDGDDDKDDDEDEVEKASTEDDAGHGELVSAVAQCAPNGRDAREAGLPNHGAIVSAVAKGGEGELLSFEVLQVDSETDTVSDTPAEYVITADMDAVAICGALDEAFATGMAAFDAANAAEGETEDTKGKPDKAEQADGEAPGKSKSADAPGKAKKNAEG